MGVVLHRVERWLMTPDGRGRVRMRLSEWAEMEGIPLRTAQRMHSRGSLPVPAYVTESGRIMVVATTEGRVATPTQDSLSRSNLLAEMQFLRDRILQIEAELSKT